MFFKRYAVYLFADILSKAPAFLLLPFLTKHLSQEEYGLLANYNSVVAISYLVVHLSAAGNLGASYFKRTKKENSETIAASVILFFLNLLLVFLILISSWGQDLIVSLGLKPEIVWLVCLQSFLTGFLLLLITNERFKDKVWNVLFIQIIVFSIQIVLTYGLYSYNDGSIELRIVAIVVAQLLASVLGIVFLLKDGFHFILPTRTRIKEVYAFGIPLIPHVLSGWLKSGADRFLITAYLGATILGIYSVGYQLATAMMILAQAIQKAISPEIYKALSNYNKHDFNRATLNTLKGMGVLAVTGLACYLLYYFFFDLIFGEDYRKSFFLILPLFLYFFIKGVYMQFASYLYFLKKNWIISATNIFISAIYISLLYLLFSSGVEPDTGLNWLVRILLLTEFILLSTVALSIVYFRRKGLFYQQL